MQTTIGDVINVIAPYSIKIEYSTVSGLPSVVAYIKNYIGIVRAYLYVVQVDTNLYCAQDTFNNPYERYVVTGNCNIPFATEKEAARNWSGLDNDYNREYKRMNIDQFITFFSSLLWDNHLISFDPKHRDIKISSEMNIRSSKIKRTIDRLFSETKYTDGTIGDLIDLVNNDHKPFNLRSLREKELKCVIAKLRDLGILAIVNDGVIVKIEFEQRK